MTGDGMTASLSKALFAPDSIALIGASGDADKHTSLPQRFLRQHGYRGEIYPINPRRSEIMGLPAFPDVASVGRPIDHAFIMVAAESVPAVVAAGVRCATLLSAGFSEIGEQGRELQAQTVANARKGHLRLVGPNSLGVVNMNAGITLTANEVFSLPKLEPGRNALISQSGSLLGALVSRGIDHGIGFSKMVSVGNEADLGVGEIGSMLVEDPDTDVVLLFLETIRDADSMRAMARRAHELGKPIIAYRLGRSRIGEKLAQSHTGALNANGASIDAFLADIGIMRVMQLEALIEASSLARRRPRTGGRRVAVMSTTGGGGGLVVDALAEGGLDIVAPDAALIDRLGRKGIAIGPSPLIDLTLAGTRADVYRVVLEEVLGSPHCDAVVAVVGSSAEYRADRAVRPILDVAPTSDKPLAVFLTPQAETSHRLLREAGIASFRTPESCGDAVRALLEWSAPPPPQDPSNLAHAVEEALAGVGEGHLDPRLAMRAMAALGIASPRSVMLPASDRLTLADLPADLRYPVVAKIVSRDIPHKTEVGGVVLNIQTPEALLDACRAILARVRERAPEVGLSGIEIQAQERGLAEALVGYVHDPSVGPMITLAAGGILAEIYDDFAIRPAPVDRSAALAMIDEIKGLATIRGFRALPRGDVGALADVVVAMSLLAHVQNVHVTEAEINPVLVRPEGEGVVALDAFLSLGRRNAG